METSQLTQQNKLPVVFILGPTGIGKSKIALSIGKFFNGVLINSDAFNIYTGADLMITKPTKEEMAEIDHKMFNLIDLEENSFHVNKYKEKCLDVIESTLNKNKIPIIVGGTNYYLYSVLFRTEVNEMSNIPTQTVSPSNLDIQHIIEHINSTKVTSGENFSETLADYLESLSSYHLGLLLECYDPKYSTFLHQNDRRRVINALIFYFVTNVPKSVEVKNQINHLRFSNSRIIFLNCTTFDFLKIRIKQRVDEYTKYGIVEVFKMLFHFHLLKGDKIDFTEGILQAIGYKEFYPLFKSLITNEENIKVIQDIYEQYEHNREDLLQKVMSLIINNNCTELLKECLNKLITNSHKYAKSQIKFIKQRIIPNLNALNLCQVNVVGFSDEDYQNYISTIISFVQTDIPEDMSSLCEKINKIDLWQKYHCDVCDCDINGENEYKSHMSSNKHKKRRLKKNKIKNNDLIIIK